MKKRLPYRYGRIFWVAGAVLASSLLATGCGITQAPKAIYLRSRALAGGSVDVTVHIAADANQNSPVAVDLLVVYDEGLMAKLLQMTAREWFAQRDQIRRDFKDGEGFDAWGWEWIPAQKIPVQELPLKPSALGALVFADYDSPGTHRFRIDPFEDIVLHLNETDFVAETEKSYEKRISESQIFTDVAGDSQ